MKHRRLSQSILMPFRNFTFVGGFLLSMLFIVSAYLPASRVDGVNRPASKPTTFIESSRKWPERIVYDTSLPTTLAVVPAEVPAAGSSVRSTPLDSMAQLAVPSAPKQVGPDRAAKAKRVKIASRVSRPRFAYLQQQRRPPNLFSAWW